MFSDTCFQRIHNQSKPMHVYIEVSTIRFNGTYSRVNVYSTEYHELLPAFIFWDETTILNLFPLGCEVLSDRSATVLDFAMLKIQDKVWGGMRHECLPGSG